MNSPLVRNRDLDIRSLDRRRAAVLIVVVLLASSILGLLLSAVLGPIAGWVFSPDAKPFWLSLRVASTATAIAGGAGLAAGYILAKARFRGRDVLEAVGSVPIILPPTVLGYYLLRQLGPGWLGVTLGRIFHHSLLQNVTALVIAASIAAFPFCMRGARTAIEGVDPRLESAARAMGLAEWRVALHVTLPLARRGLALGLTLGAVRALGEYGATLMVGADIPGRTRTMSLAVVDAPTTAQEHKLLLVLVLMAATAVGAIAWLGRDRG